MKNSIHMNISVYTDSLHIMQNFWSCACNTGNDQYVYIQKGVCVCVGVYIQEGVCVCVRIGRCVCVCVCGFMGKVVRYSDLLQPCSLDFYYRNFIVMKMIIHIIAGFLRHLLLNSLTQILSNDIKHCYAILPNDM